MKLTHPSVTVTDVLAASDFLETYSGLEPIGKKRSNLCGLPYASAFCLLEIYGERQRRA